MAPGTWDSSCSGHVDAGEDYDQAAERELGEELGLTGVKPVRWRRIEARPETANEFVWVYRLEHEGPFILHPEEIDEGAWYEPSELSREIKAHPDKFAPAFRYIWWSALSPTRSTN
jgi:isopentenyl-diphosphate delta-isomerase